MIWTLLMAAAAQPAAAASDPLVVPLAQGEGGARCLADRSLCFQIPDAAEGEGERSLRAFAPAEGEAATVSVPLAFGADGKELSLWPYLIALPRAGESGGGDSGGGAALEYLVGVIAEERAMYSGGGGSGGRLHLLRFGMAPHAAGAVEVLDVVWDSSLMIRACFSEKDMKDRRGACHDEYDFKAVLAAAPAEGGELPALTYRSFATAYPQTSRRSEDNSGQVLKKSDLAAWRDPECSYSRTLRYNPATSRYEMDRAAPDCSAYTTP